jgi:hypothetical protein
MTVTVSRGDSEDGGARSSRSPVTSPTHDPANPHRRDPACWWDHRDARWVCHRAEVHLPAPAPALDDAGSGG